jgi:hypothetical protein
VTSRFDFAFAPAYRLPALALGITPSSAYVEVDAEALQVRFGLWSLRTELDNVMAVHRTGGYAWLKTAGPPHLSLVDRGVTFATNGDSGVCLMLREPVPGIDPTGRIRHPGVTLTVADPDGFEVALRR